MLYYPSIKIANACSLLLCCYFLQVSTSSVLVDSPIGKIRGNVITGDSSDKSYVVFNNIPYAKPPVGELRFAKPEPHPKLDGVFDATDDRMVACIHPDFYLSRGYDQGSEDCLILNIYAKSINPGGTLKKVIVFIHGGGFVAGWSSFYSPISFATSHDVIAITINYRLGILGFLSTGNDAGPGNYGLWDQTMALKWVKDNIKAFGGDPDDVTLSGESAGGSSVAYQAISPAAKGLFSKGCPQSGGPTSAFGRSTDIQRHALTLAKHSKCWDGETTDKLDLKQSEVLVKCLRSVNISTLASFMSSNIADVQFVPNVDGEFIPRNPLVLLHDKSYLESIGFFDRSYLVSVTNNEFMIIRSVMNDLYEIINSNNETTEEEKKYAIQKMHTDIQYSYIKARLNIDRENSRDVVDNMIDFYTRRKVGDDAIVDVISDLSFLVPSYDFLDATVKHKKCKSWFLYFDHFPAYMKGKYRGTVHAGDLPYWFDINLEEFDKLLGYAGMKGGMDDGDLRLRSMYSEVIADFMKKGDPGLSLKNHLPSGWPTYDTTSSNYLNFNLEPTIRSHLERDKRDLWLKTLPGVAQKTHHQHEEL